METLKVLNQNTTATCEHCGRVANVHNMTSIGGKYYCEECRDDLFVLCAHCDEWTSRLDACYCEDDGEYYCEECACDHLCYCENCGSWYRPHSTVCAEDTGACYCEDCAQRNWYQCDDCGQWFARSYNGSFIGEEWYCDNCAPNHKGIIGSYHDHKNDDVEFWEVDCETQEPLSSYQESDGVIYIGTELEVENTDGEVNNETAAERIRDLFGEDHVYFEEDGSLDDGFEIITQPHSLDAYFDLDWDAMFARLSNDGFTSHDSGTCGLHIHFNRSAFGNNWDEVEENVAKIRYFYFKNFDFFKRLSRREYTGTYCKNIDHNFGDKSKDLKAMKEYRQYYRAEAINTNNYHTVEFRLGRGTLNFKSFKRWILLHYLLVLNVRNITDATIDNIYSWIFSLDARFEDVQLWIKREWQKYRS